jgi:hypothetical protein
MARGQTIVPPGQYGYRGSAAADGETSMKKGRPAMGWRN